MKSQLIVFYFIILASLWMRVNCDRNQKKLGSVTNDDPNKLEYWLLAQESLLKYIKESDSKTPYSVLRVHEAKQQLVSGLKKEITFSVISNNCWPTDGNCKLLTCKSVLWERQWIQSRKITVDCWDPVYEPM